MVSRVARGVSPEAMEPPITKIKLYPFRVFYMRTGSNAVVHRLSTSEFIRTVRGEPIEEEAREIDEKLVDSDGRLLIDTQSDGARLLKSLSDLGGKISMSGYKDHSTWQILISSGLTSHSPAGNDIVNYAITDLGRLMVAELRG
jgi:hypothetical protein